MKWWAVFRRWQLDNHIVLVVVDARTGYEGSIAPSLDSVHGQGPGIIVG